MPPPSPQIVENSEEGAGFFTSEERQCLDEHHGDVLEMLPSCSAFLAAQIQDEQKRVINVEFCNDNYFLYNCDDAEFLKTNYRTWISTRENKHLSDPFQLMPEQVQVLFEHGMVRVRTLKNRLPTGENKRRVLRSGTSEVTEEELKRRASAAVRGRKAKAVKRKANGEFANAAMNRVKPRDIEDIEVSESELRIAMEELREKLESKAVEKLYCCVPIYTNDDSDYEVIESPAFPTSEAYRLRLAVYRDLWRKGFYISGGFNFGCTYLLYEGTPGIDHSLYMVRCIASDDSDALRPMKLISLSRVASQVRKTVLIAIVSPDSLTPYYIKMNWWRVR